MEELLGYEIESILLNRVRDVFPHHQKIIAIGDEFLNAVSHYVEKTRSQEHDYAKKMKSNATAVANMVGQIQHVQNELTAVALQQKVLEKQMTNTIQQQDKLREDIKEAISQEESYALEIVDLQQELEESKTKKKIKWDGVKRASDTYKSSLQLGIRIIDAAKVCDKIRITFFKPQNNEDPQYYVDLICTADSWRVDFIHPLLTSKQEEQLKCVVNVKKQQEVSDLTRFLCIVRKIFKQQRKS